MRSWIAGRRRRAPEGTAELAAPALAALRISSGARTPERDLGRRRDATYGFQRLILPSALLDLTLLLLRQAGLHGDERFLAWAGSIASTDAFVSTVVVPRAVAGPLHGEIPAEVTAKVFDALDSRDLVPLAQVHSHPGRAIMSSIDRERPMVAVAGFFSIIVPDFAFLDADAIATWGLYRYVSPRRWAELTVAEKQETLIVDDSVVTVD